VLDRIDSEQTVQQYDEIMDIARQEQIIGECFNLHKLDEMTQSPPLVGGAKLVDHDNLQRPPIYNESQGIDANSSCLIGAQ